MSQTDLEINRDIRKVLVRHWIDLGRLMVRSSSGKASIRGSLHRIEGFNEQLTSPIVDRMFAEVRRIPAVTRISIELDNWVDTGGLWRPTADPRARKERGQARVPGEHQAAPVIFDADKPPPA